MTPPPERTRVVLLDDAALLMARGYLVVDVEWFTETTPMFVFTPLDDQPIAAPNWDEDRDAVFLLTFRACQERLQELITLTRPSVQSPPGDSEAPTPEALQTTGGPP